LGVNDLVAMALAQKLAQFNKQQEKLQASLAKTAPRPQPAAKAGPSSRKPPTPPPTTQLVPFAQRFSFTNDTEKLQQIATIRKSPVGAQIKRVLDLLLEVELFSTKHFLVPQLIMNCVTRLFGVRSLTLFRVFLLVRELACKVLSQICSYDKHKGFILDFEDVDFLCMKCSHSLHNFVRFCSDHLFKFWRICVQTRQAMLPDEINDACFVDVKNHKEVFESLKSNVKVSFDGQRFAFKVTTFLFYNPSFKFMFWVD
jgi:hypothetical protein